MLGHVFLKDGTMIEKTHKENDFTFSRTNTEPFVGAPYCLLTKKCIVEQE